MLYPAMDGRGVIHIPAHRNERVEAADGFYVIADWDLARRLGVPAAAVAVAIELNNDLAADPLSWAPQLREMLGFTRVQQVLGLSAAVANLAGCAPDDDRPQVIAALAKHFGTTFTALAVGQQHRT